MEIKDGGGHRIKYKIPIALIVVLVFCLLLPVDAWAEEENHSLYFDGGTYVNVPHNDTLNPPEEITVEAWILLDVFNLDESTQLYIIGKGNNSIGNPYTFFISRNNFVNAFIVQDGSHRGTVTSSAGINAEEWTHVAFTFNGTEINLYINGILSNTTNTSIIKTDNALALNIGGFYTTSPYKHVKSGLRGRIDELRIWNIARTQEDIQQNMYRELNGSETGLVAYWNFNEGSGSEIIDVAGNNNGTIRNRYGVINGNWQEGAPLSPPLPPVPKPTGLRSEVSGNTVTLTWDSIEGINAYKVERRQEGTEWVDLAETEINSYQDKNLNWGSTYYYRVRSLSEGQESEPSDSVTAQIQENPVPESPRITYTLDNTSIRLSWNHQNNVDGYKVYIDGVIAAELPGDQTNYAFTGERGESYTVEVEAFNESGNAKSTVRINISKIPTPGAATMAKDIVSYVGLFTAALGGLLALGIGLQGYGNLLDVIKSLFR